MIVNQKPSIINVQTPPGKGGIAVIVVSGPAAVEIVEQVFRPLPSHAAAGGGRLQLGRLIADGEVIDEAVVCVHDSFVEINLHGGPYVVQAAIKALCRLGAVAGCGDAAIDAFNPAHPEWDNPSIGREMLQALRLTRSLVPVAAVTRQWSGGISRLADAVLRSCRGAPAASGETRAAASNHWPVCLRQAADKLPAMQRVLHPPEVVLAGAPNAGKSTLTNALIGRPVSIVHATPGTTRDWVRELACLDGLPIWLTDTAGIWEIPGDRPADGVDSQAVERALECIARADVVVLLETGLALQPAPKLERRKLVRVWSKCDVRPEPIAAGVDMKVSAHTGEGMAELQAAILSKLGLTGFDPSSPMAFTQRQADLLHEAAAACDGGDKGQAAGALRMLLGSQ